MKCLEDNSFPKILRIRKKKDFQALYSEGKRYFTENFIIFIRKNGLEFPRLGITVTRKYGKAVKRNRMKRLIREFFRQNKKLFKVGYDYLIVVKKDCKLKNYWQVKEELERFLAQGN